MPNRSCSRARLRLSSRPFPDATEPTEDPADRLRMAWLSRAMLAAGGLGLVTLLAVAAWLDPDPSGRGTHRQLGLPPCTFSIVFDCPCPSCGMTTAWAHMVRGQVTRAIRANLGGALLAVLAMIAAPWTLVSAARGRWLGKPPTDRQWTIGGLTLVAVVLVDWAWRLSTG